MKSVLFAVTLLHKPLIISIYFIGIFGVTARHKVSQNHLLLDSGVFILHIICMAAKRIRRTPEQIELQLIQVAQSGRVKLPINDAQLKTILRNLQAPKREIKFRRI